MTRRDLGQLLFVGFDGAELSDGLRAFLSDLRPGGIILFSRNLVDAEQTRHLVAELRGLYVPRPLMAVDEEGGRVSRLRKFAPTLPPAAQLAARRDPALMRDLSEKLGRIVASLGFDIDFTPVVDLSVPGDTNGIADRSFGLDPDHVTTMARAVLDGMRRAGVTGCLKHFPGLGPTTSDSHLHLPTATKDERAFRRADLVPYLRLQDDCPLVMVGHGHYPFWAGPEPIAATLVPRIATDLLRNEAGFTGVAIADDLEMKAVSDHVPYEELAPRVIEAGCDMALVCFDGEAIARSHAGLRAWADDGRLSKGRLAQAFARLGALRQTALRPGPPPDDTETFRTACRRLQDGLSAIG